MSENKKNEGLDRRDFFKQVGVTATVVGATAATAGQASAKEAGDSGASAGYRETAHVKTYYELAKF